MFLFVPRFMKKKRNGNNLNSQWKKKTIFVYINSSSPPVLAHINFKLFQHSPRSIQKILFFLS